MLSYHSLEVIAEATTQRQINSQKQEILSKIKGANGYLSSLLQKRYRLDLEIRKTKKRMKKLQNLVKQTRSSDSTSSRSLHSEGLRENATILALNTELEKDLDRVLQESDQLLQEVATLHLL